MRLLAGRLVQVHFLDIAWYITKVDIFRFLQDCCSIFLARGKVKWLDRIMPLISMAGIALIIVVITAAVHESLMKVGGLLVLAVFIHNAIGYTPGYWSGRLLKFSGKDCRTIWVEVGMQNSGLASGLGLLMGGMATIGLAPAIFGPLMDIIGPTLATFWHGKNPERDSSDARRQP